MPARQETTRPSWVAAAWISASVIGTITCSAPALAQQLDNATVERLDSIVNQTARAYDIPGVSVAIVRGAGVIYQRSVGVANLETRPPVDSHTVFRMGSISKVFTATAVMQLQERGLVDLDTPIRAYLPFFRMADQNYKKITVRHLLTHTSGLPGDNKMYSGEPDFSADAIKRYVSRLHDRPLEFVPGEGYAYNNTGYVLLSSLVEEVSGTTFEDYVRAHIFEPIGMTESTFGPLAADDGNVAALHVIGADFQNTVYKKDPFTRWKTGAGGLKSTIGGLALFAETLLHGGTAAHRRILSEESLRQMWEKGTGSGDKGLAWSVYSILGGKKLVDHGGNSLGYSAELALMPDDDLAIIVLCNNRNGAEWPLTYAMLRATLGLEPREPTYYPDYWVQRILREEGPDSALAYLRKTLAEHGDDVVCYDMTLLAYRLIQASGESNLETSKAILELLSKRFPEEAMVASALGEVYFRLAKKYYRASVRRDPADWSGMVMLDQLEKVVLDFF
jgi:CubicO group peptidase (beta-lactamase class C family)